MELDRYNRLHNRQLGIVLFFFALQIGQVYFSTPKEYREDFFNLNFGMFAVMGGVLLWAIGVKASIFAVKKGWFKK